MPHFAIDNIHFENGTATVIFLKKQNQKEKNIGITPTNDLAFQYNHTYIIHPCIILRLWGMLQVVDISQMCQVPTWNSFNSL